MRYSQQIIQNVFKAILFCGITVLFFSCSKDEGGTNPGLNEIPKVLAMKDYYPLIDSAYYAIWNDGAHEEFAGYTVRGGYRFVMVGNGSTNYSYYYGTDLMAGLGIDSVLVWYTPPIPHIPDELPFNHDYNFTTAYVNGGFDVTLQITYVLKDTTTLETPAGTFSGVAHITQYTRVSHDRYYFLDTLDGWFAHNVGVIKQSIPSGASHMLSIAYTRGTQFGGSATPATNPRQQMMVSQRNSVDWSSNRFAHHLKSSFAGKLK